MESLSDCRRRYRAQIFNSLTLDMNEFKTFFLTTIPTVPAFLAAIESPSKESVMKTVLLPVCFFLVSKAVDVVVQLYIKPWLERRRQNP